VNKTAYDVFILSQSNSHGWLYKKGCFSEQKQIRLGFIWTQTTLCHFSHFNGFAATLHCQPRATSSERQNLRTRDGMHEKPPWKAKGTYTHIIYIYDIYIYIYIYLNAQVYIYIYRHTYLPKTAKTLLSQTTFVTFTSKEMTTWKKRNLPQSDLQKKPKKKTF